MLLCYFEINVTNWTKKINDFSLLNEVNMFIIGIANEYRIAETLHTDHQQII